MQGLHVKYVNETYDEKGVLKTFGLNIPADFNFGYDVVDEMARLEPNKTAMVWCDESGAEKIFSYADIKKYSDKTANFFKSLGIGKGDMVMLILKRHYEFWFSIVALHKLGAIVIPATYLLTTKDLVYRFNAAEVKAIVCTALGDITNYVDEAQAECPSVKIKIIAKGKKDGWYSFTENMEAASENFERPRGAQKQRVNDPMLIYFSSGTSGLPKMACHNFAYPLGHIVTAKHWHNVDPDGLHLTVADTGWGKAVWGKLYGQWLMEAAVFVYDYEKFKPSDLLAKIEKYKITTFCAPPTIYRFFIKEGIEGYDLSSLKYATTAGEALNPEVFNKFYQYTGLKLMEGFGQTETTLTILNSIGMEPKPGSMGKPSPQYEISIVDENGKPVPTGEVGEIVVCTKHGKPAGLFSGYYNDKERTDAAWHDGYYHTGDTAWQDEDGYLWYIGRTDDVIKSSGYRISPFEIESVLIEHSAVLECAVTAAPDPVRGQVVKATIVLTREYTASDELAKEIKDYVKHATAPYKYPRIIEFVGELPKTINGKIRRVEIREKSKQTGK
ncbi:MAG TPA: acetyl-CoA synthetase [Firmicutes bacterium]|jgi:acetyl-CoA synthetase|nr:acetyl-CoA synthetase [Bacillota bacterium]